MRVFFLIVTTSFFLSSAFAANVAVVKLLRGDVDSVENGKTLRLKVNDWVSDGATVKTSEKSFVKLVFLDKSQMNIGPASEMKIEKFSDKDSGVIDLVKGKIRSQVTKDYLQIQDKDKSKLFIKTKTAVLGVRGTDFMVSTNGMNTATVLFEGEIVFNKLDNHNISSPGALENIVDQGVRIMPGEFSVVDPTHREPTVPSVLNVHQREALEKNENFDSSRSPSSASTDKPAASVVPPGLDGQTVSNTSDSLKSAIATAVPDSQPTQTPVKSDPNGYVDGDKIKPANGSFVHIDSGVIIPPDPSSVLDKNTNTFISTQNGTVGADGNYVPPKNIEITTDGKILVSVADKGGAIKQQEIAKPNPVVNPTGVSLAKVGEMAEATRSVAGSLPTSTAPALPIKNDILNANFVPSGLTDLSNNQRNSLGGGISTINDAAVIKSTTDTKLILQKEP